MPEKARWTLGRSLGALAVGLPLLLSTTILSTGGLSMGGLSTSALAAPPPVKNFFPPKANPKVGSVWPSKICSVAPVSTDQRRTL